jgi:UDP-N-acetylmuramoyl-L-alanyl-D-glutamate--2,6-diaminopimelate ligase
MVLTLSQTVQTLEAHHLLSEIVQNGQQSHQHPQLGGVDESYEAITYDSRAIEPGTLLFCKGAFKASYLSGADKAGLAAYVSETAYPEAGGATGIIVTDVRKAMSLLSAQFYGCPAQRMTVIGITGTKGKTTTAYFTQAVLNAASGGKAALSSSAGNCLDGATYQPADLTTPESLDTFRMMRTAADNGMNYYVMEVSSQAYKVDRVYGLTFDVGAFLNISPDHISPLEHPTFEDYFNCKRQITFNSKKLALGADCDHADLIRADADEAGVPVTTFAVHSSTRQTGTAADTVAWPANAEHTAFHIALNALGADSTKKPDMHLAHADTYRLAMVGDFNYANAAAALTIAQQAGVDLAQKPYAAHALEAVQVTGRMECFTDHGDPDASTIAIADFAHNHASVTALIDFVNERYGTRTPKITLVTGTAGGKALDRRREIIEAAQDRVDELILTSDDPDTEDPAEICKSMASHITSPTLHVRTILDRARAVETAITEAQRHDGFDVVLVIGKGKENWIKVDGRHIPYEGDIQIITRLFEA